LSISDIPLRMLNRGFSLQPEFQAAFGIRHS
jgi:hypothetical protein